MISLADLTPPTSFTKRKTTPPTIKEKFPFLHTLMRGVDESGNTTHQQGLAAGLEAVFDNFGGTYPDKFLKSDDWSNAVAELDQAMLESDEVEAGVAKFSPKLKAWAATPGVSKDYVYGLTIAWGLAATLSKAPMVSDTDDDTLEQEQDVEEFDGSSSEYRPQEDRGGFEAVEALLTAAASYLNTTPTIGLVGGKLRLIAPVGQEVALKDLGSLATAFGHILPGRNVRISLVNGELALIADL